MKKSLLFLAVNAIAFGLFAQTGPGGVGSSTNCELWLDATRLGLANGASISSITDFSGNGNNATQGNVSRQPQFLTGEINSLGTADFDGVNDHVRTGSIADLATNTVSWFIVLSADNTTQTGIAMASNSGTSSQQRALFGSYMTPSTNDWISWGRKTTGALQRADIPHTAGYQILSARWNSSNFRGYKNGAFVDSDNGAPLTPGSSHNWVRFGAHSFSLNFFFDGKIAEAIIYDDAIDTVEHVIVYNYLSAKYNIGIGGIDQYAYDAAGTYNFEVAGIGQENSVAINNSQGTGIVRIHTPTTMTDGEYLFWGHDSATTGGTTSLTIPSGWGVGPDSARMTREWRVGETGETGTVTIEFDMTGAELGDTTQYYLLVDTDNDGDFTDASFFGPGTWAPATKTVSFSGIDLDDGNYFTIANADAIIVTVQDGNWHTGSTWSCNCVPNSGSVARIATTHDVTISVQDAQVDSLTLEGTASLIFADTDTLEVETDLIFNGTSTLTQGTGTISFEGSGAQVLQNNTGAAITLSNLEVDNSASSLTISAGDWELENALFMNDGNLSLAAGSEFTFLSDAVTTARIAPVATGSTIAGYFTTQLHITTRTDNWADLAPSVDQITIGEWDTYKGNSNEIFLSGVGGLNGNACCPVFRSVWRFDAASSTWLAYTDTTSTRNAGTGTEIWLGTTATQWTAATIDNHGTPVTGTQNVTAFVNGATDENNLIGNPFQSFVDWDLVHAASVGLSTTMYELNNGSNETHTTGAGHLIGPMQGFWVTTSLAVNGTASFLESSKTTTTATDYESKLANPVHMTLKLSTDQNEYSSKLKLYFRNEALHIYDPEYFDARFFRSRVEECPFIYTKSDDNVELSQRAVNSHESHLVMPVTTDVGVTGRFTINASGIDAMQGYSCVLLEDTETGVMIDLSEEGSQYSYQMAASDDENRFNLHFYKFNRDCAKLTNIMQPNVISDNSAISIQQTRDEVKVNVDLIYSEDVRVSVYNPLGQLMHSRVYAGVEQSQLRIAASEFAHGVNLVVVETSTGKTVKRVTY